MKNSKLLALSIVAIVIFLLFWLFGPIFAINTTASLPKGFYIINKTKDREIEKGDIILFYDDSISVWAAERGYIKKGQAIGKRVAAVGGDNIDAGPEQVLVWGQTVAGKADKYDSKKRVMNIFQFHGEVPKNCVFLIGDTHNSFDSRYYGFVNTQKIIAKITPFIVW